MGAKATADPDTRIITFTEAPTNGLVSIRVLEDVYSDLKNDWLTDPNLAKLRFPLEPVGGDPISDAEEVGKYVFVRNQDGWRLRPFDANQELTVRGNLFSRDNTQPLYLSRAGRTIIIQSERSAQATVQQIGAIEFSSFSGGVTVDPSSSFSGTSFPVGSPQAPVNNVADALTIAANRGLQLLYVVRDVTLSAGDFSGFVVRGRTLDTVVTIANTATVGDAVFENCTVEGTVAGSDAVHIHDCTTLNLSAAHLHILRSGLRGTLTLTGSMRAMLINCYDEVAGLGVPTIDMGGSGSSLLVRNYNGGIEITNKTGSDDVSIEVDPGRVILDATVTTGTILIRGTGELVDNGSTADVDADNLLETDRIGAAARSGF